MENRNQVKPTGNKSAKRRNKAVLSRRIRIERLLITGHSHVGINSRTERRKASAAEGRSLGTSFCAENTTGDTTSGNTVGKIVLCAEAFDAALSAGVERTDDTEVLSRGPGAGAHVLKTAADLFAPGEVGDSAALGCEGRVVGHLSRVNVRYETVLEYSISNLHWP